MLSRVKLTNADIVRGRPSLKSNTECFRNDLVRELKEKQRKLSRHSMTSKTHGPHRRNDKSEYQECTCKMDESLKRGMFHKFQSRKICAAGYSTFLPTDVLLFHRKLFYCSTMRCPTVPPRLFHCSTIRWFTVPPSDFPLFHHQIFHSSTMRCSNFLTYLFLCSTFRCSTVPP